MRSTHTHTHTMNNEENKNNKSINIGRKVKKQSINNNQETITVYTWQQTFTNAAKYMIKIKHKRSDRCVRKRVLKSKSNNKLAIKMLKHITILIQTERKQNKQDKISSKQMYVQSTQKGNTK